MEVYRKEIRLWIFISLIFVLFYNVLHCANKWVCVLFCWNPKIRWSVNPFSPVSYSSLYSRFHRYIYLYKVLANVKYIDRFFCPRVYLVMFLQLNNFYGAEVNKLTKMGIYCVCLCVTWWWNETSKVYLILFICYCFFHLLYMLLMLRYVCFSVFFSLFIYIDTTHWCVSIKWEIKWKTTALKPFNGSSIVGRYVLALDWWFMSLM